MPEGYVTYFTVSAGAGAALLGLIFIAVSISPEKTLGKDAPIERRLQADSAYTALVNAFFVSLTALPPNGGVGWGALLLSIFALQSTIRSFFKIFFEMHGWFNVIRRLFLVIVSLGIYVLEFFTALDLLNSPNNAASLATLTSLVSGIFGVGIVRAWELFGTDRELFLRVFTLLENFIQRNKDAKAKEEAASVESPVVNPSPPVPAQPAATIEKTNPVQASIAVENIADK